MFYTIPTFDASPCFGPVTIFGRLPFSINARLPGGSRRGDGYRVRSRQSLQGLSCRTDHPAHETQAVAPFQTNGDCHGGNFAPKGDFLPLECGCALRENQNFKPKIHSSLSEGAEMTLAT